MGVERDPSAVNGAEPFGKYYLLERIAAGGMAEVFLAVALGPEGFQRTVVIKRMLPHLSQDGAFVQMFIDEAKLSGLLSHPNIVQIYEFGKVGDSFFIAMEHVNGRTLAAVQLKLAELGRRAPVAACLEIARQVCLGLQYAHALHSPAGQLLGVVHRDISPTNLMLSFHGGVKILDFGIARVAEELRDVQTQAGTLKGKVAYMAPEQVRLERVDGRCDIFALGIVLHEMLTQRRLFRATPAQTASQRVLDTPIPLPSSLNPAIAAEVDRIVLRALERSPDARYQTAGEIADDLEQVLLEMRVSPHEPQKLLRSLFPHPPPRTGELPLPPLPPMSFGVPAGDIDSGALLRSSSGASRSLVSQPASGSWPAGAIERDRRGALEPGTMASPMRRRARRTRVAVLLLAMLAIAGGAVAVRTRLPGVARRAQAVLPFATRMVRGPAPPVAAPHPSGVRVSLDSSPQDAEVVREDSGEVVGRTPLTITLPQARDVITFRFAKPGRVAAHYKVIPDLDKAVRVDLPAEPPAQLADTAEDDDEAPEATATHHHHHHHHHHDVDLPAPGGAAAPPAPGAPRDCTLSVASFPWTELWIDGKDTGERTPVVHYRVACGAHKLALRRRDLKLDRVESVMLIPGRELKQHYELGDDYGE